MTWTEPPSPAATQHRDTVSPADSLSLELSTEHAPESQARVWMSGTLLTPSGVGWHCFSMAKRLSYRLQFPASCILSLSGMTGWPKVALGCPTMLHGMFKASRAQVVRYDHTSHQKTPESSVVCWVVADGQPNWHVPTPKGNTENTH